MKAIVVDRPSSYGLQDVARPGYGDDGVLVEVKCCAICASDFEILHGLNDVEVTYPVIPGHEWSGRVVEAGANHLHLIGRRVTANNVSGCGACLFCRSGRPHICRDKSEIGFSENGAYAEYMAVPGANIVELPPALGYESASLAEPTAVCLRALARAGLRTPGPAGVRPLASDTFYDRNVLIVGDGPIGLLTAILARRSGVLNLMIAGHHSRRLDLCAEWTGTHMANTHDISLAEAVRAAFGRKADVIIETTGNGTVVSESLTVLEQGATLCLLGSYRSNTDVVPNDLVLKEQNVLGSVSYTRPELGEAVDLLGHGLLNGKSILTHRFSLEDYAPALKVVAERGDNVIKACLVPVRGE